MDSTQSSRVHEAVEHVPESSFMFQNEDFKTSSDFGSTQPLLRKSENEYAIHLRTRDSKEYVKRYLKSLDGESEGGRAGATGPRGRGASTVVSTVCKGVGSTVCKGVGDSHGTNMTAGGKGKYKYFSMMCVIRKFRKHYVQINFDVHVDRDISPSLTFSLSIIPFLAHADDACLLTHAHTCSIATKSRHLQRKKTHVGPRDLP